MDILNIILIVLIMIVIYKFYDETIKLKKSNETFAPTKFEENNNDNNKNNSETNVNVIKKKKNISKMFESNCVKRMHKKNKKNNVVSTNPYYQEMQFHQDYRDTLNAFNLLCEQKKVFNKSDTPILKASNPPIEEIQELVNRFVKELNKLIRSDVGDIAGQKLDTWNDNMPTTNLRKKDDNWNKYMKDLGLPPSIYPEPANRAQIKLIKIDHIEKLETTSETKYSVHLIIQKKNVVDQMIVKISFVIDNNDINLDREFFKQGKNSYETSVIIEDISVEGYLITQGFGNTNYKTTRQKLNQFDGFSDGRMISEKDVIKQLNDKKREIKENFVRGN